MAKDLAASARCRAAISVVIVLAVGVMVLWNLPDSPAQHRVASALNSPVLAVGLDQQWRMFADPRTVSLELAATITWTDGMTTRWAPPRPSLLGGWRDYRWQKWMETMVNGVDDPLLLADASDWVQQRSHRDGATVTTVEWLVTRRPLNGGPTTIEPLYTATYTP